MKKALLAVVVAVLGLAWMAAPASADHFHRRGGHGHGPAHVVRHYDHYHAVQPIRIQRDPWCGPSYRRVSVNNYYRGYPNDGGLYLQGRNFSFGIGF